MKHKLLILVCVVFIITGCVDLEQKEEINKVPETGDFILGKHNKNNNKYLIGQDMKLTDEELQNLLTNTPDELLNDYESNLFWLDVSKTLEPTVELELGKQVQITYLSNAQQDTIPPTRFAKEIEIIN